MASTDTLSAQLGASTNSLGAAPATTSSFAVPGGNPTPSVPFSPTAVLAWQGLTSPGAYAGMASQAAGMTQDLADQQLQLYESGQLMPGTQAAIERAYEQGQNALTSTFAAQGRDPVGDTTYAQGVGDLENVRSIAVQGALEQELSDYMASQALELQAAQVGGQISVGHEANMVQQEAIKAQENQSTLGIFSSLLGGLGKLFGGALGGS